MLRKSNPGLIVFVLMAALVAFGAFSFSVDGAQANSPSNASEQVAASANEDDHTDHTTPDGHAAETAHVDAHGEDATHAADEAHGDPHGDAHDEGHTAVPHLTNIVALIAKVMPPKVATIMTDFVDPIFSLITITFLTIFFVTLGRKLSLRKPGRTQMAAEMVLGALYSLFETVIGSSARRYTPYLGTLFLFILLNNLSGLIFLGHSSTSSFGPTTLVLGLTTFFYVQGIALKENGIGGYLHHMAGSPKTGLDWGFSLLLFPLHVLGELIKPLSLGLRLFGNIFGEDTLVATMVLLGAAISFGMTGSNFVPGIPLQFPFLFLGLLSCTIQALVFTLLSTVYIALWLPHGDHGEEHGH